MTYVLENKYRGHAALAGASVVVTRPAGSSASLKRRIRASGGNVVSLPGISVRGVQNHAAVCEALHATRAYDAVIFVSPNAVRYAYRIFPELRFARTTCVVAVGAATTRALTRRGARDVLHPARQDSEGVLGLAEFVRPRGRRVAVIGAPGGRELLPTALRTRGAIVQSIHVYQRAAPRLTRRHLAALEAAPPPLLTLLSSREALANLQIRLPSTLLARLAAGEAIVSSTRLAFAARRTGFARVHIAASANSADMLDAAIAALARHRL